MFFDDPTPAEQQADIRAKIAFIAPKTADDVKLMAAGLKTWGDLHELVFLDWAAPFGRWKAKALWTRTRADPDALIEVAERHKREAEKRGRFQPRTAAEVERMPIPAYRVKGVLPAEGLAVIYGASGSGKSFLATAVAAAIGEGSPFFGHPTVAAEVLYVALEGEVGYRGRVQAWRLHHGRPMPERLAFLLQRFNLTNATDVFDLAATCPPGCVVIIDTLNRAAPGLDENSSKDMGAVIEGAKNLQRSLGGLVVLVAHTGKDTSKGVRGHSSLFAALDAAILVTREGAVRRWKVDKAKDGKDGEQHGFRLEVVELGFDQEGDPVSSCVAIPDASSGPPKPLSGYRQLGLATLHEAATNGVIDEGGAFVGVPLAEWRTAFYRNCPAENEDAKRKAFKRAREDLIELGLIAVHDNVYRFSGPQSDATNAVIAATLAVKRDKRGTLA